MTPQQDIERGKEAVRHFHNAALRYPWNYSKSEGELHAYLNSKAPTLLEGLGFAIRSAGMDETRVQRSMQSLAEAGQGRMPQRTLDFINVLSSEATRISFWEAVKTVTEESAADLAEGAAQVGERTLETLETSALILPFALAGGILLYFFVRAKTI